MRTIHNLFPFLFLFFFTQGTGAQDKNNIFHPGAYVLDLPASWMKPRILAVVTEILPRTIDELKDRHFYTSGKADYHVKLYIDSLEVKDESFIDNSHLFTYSFYGALAVYDSLNNIVSMLRLYSRDDWQEYSKKYVSPARKVSYDYNIYDTAGTIIGQRPLPVEESPSRPRHHTLQILTLDFLQELCERKLFVIRKYLRKLDDN